MKTHSVGFTAREKAEYLVRELETVPSSRNMLVKTHFDLISAGTELANYHGLPNTCADDGYPIFTGYSASGIVEAVGPEVKKFKPGDRVLCNKLAHHARFLAGEEHFYPIPDDVSMETAAAAFLCTFPLLGVRKLQLQMGESVMVAGLGLLGQFSAQIARINGAAPVLVCDFSPERRELALQLGADHALDPREKDFIEKVKELTDGRGPEGVVEVTGYISALQQALEYVAWQGRISLLGCTRVSDQTIDFYRYVHRRGVQLIGCHTATRPQRDSFPGQWTEEDDYRTFFKYVRTGRLQVDPVIPHRADPRDAENLFKKIGSEKIPPLGILFDWRDID